MLHYYVIALPYLCLEWRRLMFSNGLQLMLLFVRDVNTRVLGYLGLVWPTRVPWNQRSAQLPRSPSSKYCIGCSRKREAAHVLIACSSPTQFTVVSSCMWWSGCKLAGVDTVHAFIYVRRVGFVKYHEWRVACNHPTLVCPRKIAAAISFEVALHMASVAHSFFMMSQLYRRLSALSVLSRYC